MVLQSGNPYGVTKWQPLWCYTMATPMVLQSGNPYGVTGKGNRQNRSVTSGKGLALRVGYRGPCSDVRAEQKLLDAFWWIVDSRMARIGGQGTPFGAFPVQ